MNPIFAPAPVHLAAPAAAVHLAARIVRPRDHARDLPTDPMFRLLSQHFVDVDRATFDRDLAEKNIVILLEDSDGILRGFSTMLIYRTAAPGREVAIVYSGDTIVERAWWGSPVLARAWIDTVRRVTRDDTPREVYWLLLTSGFRTYRFLPTFFCTFHPRFDEATPALARHLLNAIARERFGESFDERRGIVRFDRPYALAPDLRDVPAGRTEDPHVQFFLDRNPGFVVGDELVSLTPIDDGNLTAAGRRMAGLRRRE
jgi:hypothetical protein